MSRNFRGKRHSPYNSRPWRDRRGGRNRARPEDHLEEPREVNPREELNQPQPISNQLDPATMQEDNVNNEQQQNTFNAETTNLSTNSIHRKEKKFGNRSRLYVGNLPRAMTEDELRKLFEQFGEIDRVYIEKDKNFGFVRMAYRFEGEKAIAALNGEDINGREIRVRFAASSSSVKVHNLHHTVSNELLLRAFSNFGEVEYATVVTDDRGKSLGYGIVDFAKKVQAVNAIERCRNGCFILTRSPMPVFLTELNRENEEGLPEKQIQNLKEYAFERDSFPRMALPGTPEFDFGMKWKNLYEAEKRIRDEVEGQLKEQRRLLESEMDNFHHLEHAAVIRQQLMEHQREQARLEQRLREHEEFMKSAGGVSILPPPIMGGGMLPPPLPHQPQPLMIDNQVFRLLLSTHNDIHEVKEAYED